MDISAEVRAIKPALVDNRRALHRMPEISEREFKTSDFIAARLKALKIRFRRMGTGLVADIAGRESGHTVAYRADIDGLPIAEKSGVEYAAATNMHACGHDGHTAVLLALAELLTRKKPLYDTRLIFQFGEEGAGGAERMIADGALDGVGEIYAFHVCPELDAGRLASSPGPLFAGTVEFDALFTGQSAHCADRDKGRDALAAAVAFVSRLPETVKGFAKNTLMHTGRLEGGTARNVVAGSATAECTFRYFDRAHMEAGMMNVESLACETAAAAGTDHEIAVRAVYKPLLVSRLAYNRMREAAPLEPAEPRFTSEDFSAYCELVPGCLVWLGTRDARFSAPLHSDRFGLDEEALLYGVQAFYTLSGLENKYI